MISFCNALKLKSVIFKATAWTRTDFHFVLNGIELIAFKALEDDLLPFFDEKVFLPAIVIIPKGEDQTQPKGDYKERKMLKSNRYHCKK